MSPESIVQNVAQTEAARVARETHRDVLTGTAWLLLPMSVLPFFIHFLIGEKSGWRWDTGSFEWMYIMAAVWAVGCLLLPRTHYLGRGAVTGAILGTLVFGGNPLVAKPVLLLAFIVVVILILSRLWLFNDLHFLSAHYAQSSNLKRVGRDSRLAALGALVVTAVNWILDAPEGHIVHFAAFVASSIAFLALVVAIVRAARSYAWRALLIVLATLLVLVAINAGQYETRFNVVLTLVPSMAGLFILPRGVLQSGEQIDWWEPLIREPSRLFVATFVGFALTATFFLLLPISAPEGARLSVIDAMFMAVSAVCVTGLATVDPLHDLSIAGRVFLLVAAQLGGLGVMTFSLAAIGVLRRRISLRMETAVAGLFSDVDRSTIRRALKVVFLYTFGIEIVGASILTAFFRLQGMSWFDALGHGVFSAVSAFNNAGFSLTGASLMPFVNQPAVLGTFSMLVILGGSSPFMLLAIMEWRKTRRMHVAHRLALFMTLALLAAGWLGFLAIEWQHTMRDLSWVDKVSNAFLQSTSARTAGFSTLELYDAHPATVMMLMVLMTIGGNPGSVAGGIKTTTAAVLFLAVVAAIRGRSYVQSGYRYLPHAAVYRAAATASVMVAAIFGFSMLMLLTQSLSARQLIFEVVSALSTTGHSLNTTPELDAVGKSIIIGCMFIGRVGMLTLFMFLSSRELVGTWQLAEENVDLG